MPFNKSHCLREFAALTCIGLAWMLWRPTPVKAAPVNPAEIDQTDSRGKPAAREDSQPVESPADQIRPNEHTQLPTPSEITICDYESASCCGKKTLRRACCCQSPSDGWFTADYLNWWLQGDRVPALVTSSPAGTAQSDVGILGLPTTTVLLGDERIADAGRPGVRIGLGQWLDVHSEWALAGEGFWVSEDAVRFSAFSAGDPALARPFFNTDPNVNAEDAELVAFDDPVNGDVLDGRVSLEARSEIYSTNVDLEKVVVRGLCRSRGYRVALLGGYRFFRLNERLEINEDLLVTGGGAVAAGTTFEIVDRFAAANEFHGAEFGVKSRWLRGPWTFDALAKLGLGNNRQRVSAGGSTAITVPTFDPFVTEGGLLVQETNSGATERDRFALLPELQLKAACRLNNNWEWHVGYTLLFLTDAVRPGAQIDRQVDGRFLDPNAGPFTPTNPAFAFEDSSVWLQGVNVGLTYRY
jgi:hypothetical protein